MPKNELISRYEQAAAILPSRLRKAALALSSEEKAAAEELRLRAGRPLTVLLPAGELPLEAEVEPEELETLCDIATEFSRYAASESIREGFLPVRGGFRIGLCGTAVMKDGANTNLKNLSSAAIRIARERKGVAEGVAPRLFRDGGFVNTLILSPPGAERRLSCGTWYAVSPRGGRTARPSGFPSLTSGGRWRWSTGARLKWTWGPGRMCWTPAPRPWASPSSSGP